MAVSRNKLDKKDITKLGLYSLLAQVCFTFERMQAPGFCMGLIPGFKKIYGDQKEEIAAAMKNNMDFMNSEPHMVSFIQGLVMSLEESGQDRELIKNVKTGLFGPLAGFGDAIFWFTLFPVSAVISCSLASGGSVMGPLLFMAIWAVAAFSRVWFTRFGYKLGVGAVDMISKNANAISKAAGILGIMVVGGLIPSYVSFNFAEDLTAPGGVAVQGIFDSIIPSILPLGFVLLFVWMLKKKNMGTVSLILLIIVVSIIASALGIM